ncbi:GNAT family N-acetyltransferase [Streptomyces sp. NPDC058371]|uniref:GNAT family N-acetyltransferase n=1 Tax=Streptomyces sp. NPDC058371 TaxID=3346463 RepID=UPI0036569910
MTHEGLTPQQDSPPEPTGITLCPAAAALLHEIAEHDTGAGVHFDHFRGGRVRHPNTGRPFSRSTFRELGAQGLVEFPAALTWLVRMTDTGLAWIGPTLTVSEVPEDGAIWFEVLALGERIGYAEVAEYGAGYWLHQVSVDRHRRHGHGTRLLTAVIERLGHDEIALSCDPGRLRPGYPTREQLATWYGRHGFRPDDDLDTPHRMVRPPTPPN